MRTKHLLTLTFIGSLLASALPVLATAQNTLYDVSVYITVQQFYGGTMLYRSDTGLIWAIFNDGTAYEFPSASYGALPDNPISVTPPGRIRPINGFGRIWGNHAWVRTKLGWAIRSEYGLTTRLITHDQTVYILNIYNRTLAISANRTWRYVTSIPDPPADLQPSVDALTVTPDPVNAGGTITITWAARNTDTVLIEVYNAANEIITVFEELPLTGEVFVSVPITATAQLRIVVWGANRPNFYVPVKMYEHVISAEAVIGVTAYQPQTIYTQAAYQPYEHGFMIWRADSGAVLVFAGSQGGQLYTFAEDSYGALPDNPYTTPPDGLIAPVSGFGKVWGNTAFVRDQLGWATGPEQPYDMTIESYDTETAYLLPEGRIAQVTWHNFWTLE
ncbi:MAG: hypothetical protein JXA10_18460 [Anaerolineae bacterium]|nr:hypothetical protein [Anaerolineae bacterium]